MGVWFPIYGKMNNVPNHQHLIFSPVLLSFTSFTTTSPSTHSQALRSLHWLQLPKSSRSALTRRLELDSTVSQVPKRCPSSAKFGEVGVHVTPISRLAGFMVDILSYNGANLNQQTSLGGHQLVPKTSHFSTHQRRTLRHLAYPWARHGHALFFRRAALPGEVLGGVEP